MHFQVETFIEYQNHPGHISRTTFRLQKIQFIQIIHLLKNPFFGGQVNSF